MTLNISVGYDGNAPQIITGTVVSGTVLSGGMAVGISGGVNVVNSGGTSFNPASDIIFQRATATNFVGLAAQTAGSEETLAVVCNGAHIVNAGSAVTAGGMVEYIASTDSYKAGVTAGNVVGRALTGATSGNAFILQLR